MTNSGAKTLDIVKELSNLNFYGSADYLDLRSIPSTENRPGPSKKIALNAAR